MYLINFMNRSVYILYIAYIPCMYHLYSLKQTFFRVCEWVISVVIFILFYFLFCEAQVWNVNGDRWNQRGFFFLFSFCRIQSYASSPMNRELRNHSAASWFGLLWSVGVFRSPVKGCDMLRYCGGKLSVGG